MSSQCCCPGGKQNTNYDYMQGLCNNAGVFSETNWQLMNKVHRISHHINMIKMMFKSSKIRITGAVKPCRAKQIKRARTYFTHQQRGHGETNTCIDFAPNNMFQGSKGDAQGVQEEIARFEGYELFLNSVC